jgi:hypothetical protein
MKLSRAVAPFAVLSIAFGVAACADDDAASDTTGGAGATTTPAETGATTTAAADTTTGESAATTTPDTGGGGEAACPSELVIQTDWFPELEHGGTYQLIGTGGTISKDQVNYSGPVQEQYKVPGLETIVINTVNFDKVNSAVLLDGAADMAYITSSDVIKDSAAVPMVAIAKTFEKDPQMVMWDPTVHDIQKPEDIAGTGAQVLHFPGAAYIDYMIATGIMTKDQSNPSYNGSDAAWVADGGNFFQQGFSTNEIFKYEKEIAWKNGAPADVSFYTVGDLGFDNYPATITMLKSRAEELDACLKVFVPKMQQAWVDFLDDPKPITDKMIEINIEHDGFWGLSAELNEAGLALAEEGGYVANSSDGTYCSFDLDRLQTLYDQVKPIYDEKGVEIADSIDGLFTNEYCEGAPGR